MIQIIENGNIFESKCQTLVNPVNTVGVMGKGLALSFKNKFPNMFLRYKDYCDKHFLPVGKLYLYKGEQVNVLCFPTKEHWKYPSRKEYIELGLKNFMRNYKSHGISSVAFPLLGCGLGGLNKEEVLDLMEKFLSKCDIPVEIYV